MEMENTLDIHIYQVFKFFHLILLLNLLGQIFGSIWIVKGYIQKVGYIIQVNVPMWNNLSQNLALKNNAKSLNNFQLLWKFHPFSTFFHFNVPKFSFNDKFHPYSSFIHVQKIIMWHNIFFNFVKYSLDMIKHIPKRFTCLVFWPKTK
jgi:hypothetical protein